MPHIIIRTDLDLTPAGKRTARIVTLRRSGRPGHPVVRLR